MANEETPVLLHFELAEGTNDEEAERIAAAVQEKLASLDAVAEAEATKDETRLTGVEVAAGVAAAVLIVKSGRELVEELKKLIPAIRGFIAEIRGVKGAAVEVGKDRVPIEQVSDEDLEKVAASPGPGQEVQG